MRFWSRLFWFCWFRLLPFALPRTYPGKWIPLPADRHIAREDFYHWLALGSRVQFAYHIRYLFHQSRSALTSRSVRALVSRNDPVSLFNPLISSADPPRQRLAPASRTAAAERDASPPPPPPDCRTSRQRVIGWHRRFYFHPGKGFDNDFRSFRLGLNCYERLFLDKSSRPCLWRG